MNSQLRREPRGGDAVAAHVDDHIRRFIHDNTHQRWQHLTPANPTWELPPRLHSCTEMSQAELTIVIDDSVPVEHCPCGRWRLFNRHGGNPTHWEGVKNSRRKTRR